MIIHTFPYDYSPFHVQSSIIFRGSSFGKGSRRERAAVHLCITSADGLVWVADGVFDCELGGPSFAMAQIR